MSLRQLLYVSRAASDIESADVSQIAALSKRNNYRLDITGCLLFTGRSFAQVLEGRPGEVQKLVDKLTLDPRHHDLRILLDRAVRFRRYDRWRMAYVLRLDLADELNQLFDRESEEREVECLISEMRPDTIAGEL